MKKNNITKKECNESKMVCETDGNFTIAALLKGNVIMDLYPNHFYKYETVEKLLNDSYISDLYYDYARALIGAKNVIEIRPVDISKPLSGGKWYGELNKDEQDKFEANYDDAKFQEINSKIVQYMKGSDWKKIVSNDYSETNESDDFEDTYTYNVQDIEWDCDDEARKHLPTEVDVEVPMEVIDNGSEEVKQYLYDYLSDTYDCYCCGFTLDEEVDDDSIDESSESHGYDYKVTNIAWDVDDSEDLDNLPESIIVTVPEEICAVDEEEEWISDYLSDTYGFCHNGFIYEPVGQFEESMDIRKHRFVPKMDTSTKAYKSMKDKARERERRDWNQRLRNGDYDDFDDEDYDDFEESTQENWHGIDGATYSDDDENEYIRYNKVVVPYDVFVDELQNVYLNEVNPKDIYFHKFDDWMMSKTSSDRIRKELDIISKEMANESRNKDWFGIKGARYIYHGDWADPEIQYDGMALNYFDVEQDLLDIYRDENPNDKNDKGFDDWMAKPSTKPIIQSELDNLVQGGCGTPLDEYDRDEEVIGDYMVEDSSDEELTDKLNSIQFKPDEKDIALRLQIDEKDVELADEKIDDGCDDDENTYVMCRVFNIKYNGSSYTAKFYYGDITEDVGYVDVRQDKSISENLEKARKLGFMGDDKDVDKWMKDTYAQHLSEVYDKIESIVGPEDAEAVYEYWKRIKSQFNCRWGGKTEYEHLDELKKILGAEGKELTDEIEAKWKGDAKSLSDYYSTSHLRGGFTGD